MAGEGTYPHFLGISMKYAKVQSNPTILFSVIVSSDAGQTTDRLTLFKKPFYLTQMVSKRKDLMKIPKVVFHIKPTPSHMMI